MKKIVFIFGFLFYCFAATSIAQTKDIQQLKKEAQQGNAIAQNALGYAYFSGDGITKDVKHAVIWFKKAAIKGHREAQANLAYCYREGIGIAKNLNQAFVWEKKAAEKGDLQSQNNLGFYYENGMGVAKNLKQAAVWYRKAADQGLDIAKENLKRLEEKIANSNISDVVAFDLKGKVKSCKIYEKDISDVLRFLSGNASALIDGDPIEEHTFKANGQYIPKEGEKVTYEGKCLKKIKLDTDQTEYIYKNGRLQNKNFQGSFWGMPVINMYIFTYDSNGMIIKEECKSNDGSLVTTYSDYKYDSQGNWVKRVCKTGEGLPKGQVRVIRYY